MRRSNGIKATVISSCAVVTRLGPAVSKPEKRDTATGNLQINQAACFRRSKKPLERTTMIQIPAPPSVAAGSEHRSGAPTTTNLGLEPPQDTRGFEKLKICGRVSSMAVTI